MSDLHDHFSLSDRISDLEAENLLLRKKLKASQNLTSKNKVKWRKLYEQHNPPIVTRGDKAMVLIDQKYKGELTITFKQIAKQCFVTHNHVLGLAIKYREAQKKAKCQTDT